MPAKMWSLELIVASLQEKKKRGLSIAPTALTPSEYRACMKYGGSWEKTIRAAGFNLLLERKNKLRTKESLIAYLRDRKALGLSIAPTAISHAEYEAGRHYFGSWRRWVNAAGFSPDEEYRQIHRSQEWTIEQLRVIKSRGEPITQQYLNRHYKPVFMAIMQHFSGHQRWRQAVTRAGFDPEVEISFWTGTKVIRGIWALKTAGRPVNHIALPRPLRHHAIKIYGSTDNALLACGLDPVKERVKASKWEPEEVIEALHRLKSRVGRLAPTILIEFGIYTTVVNKFGSVERGLRIAGYDPVKEYFNIKLARKKGVKEK